MDDGETCYSLTPCDERGEALLSQQVKHGDGALRLIAGVPREYGKRADELQAEIQRLRESIASRRKQIGPFPEQEQLDEAQAQVRELVDDLVKNPPQRTRRRRGASKTPVPPTAAEAQPAADDSPAPEASPTPQRGRALPPPPPGGGSRIADLRGKGPVKVASLTTRQFEAPTLKERRSMVRRWARDHLVGPYTNQDTGWVIEVSASNLDKATSHSETADHFEALRALPQLLQHAVLVESNNPRRGAPDVRAFHRLYAPLHVMGRWYRVKLTVKELLDGRRFYDHSLVEMTRPGRNARPATESPDEPAPGPDTLIIGDLLAGVKAEDGRSVLDSDGPDVQRGRAWMTGKPDLRSGVRCGGPCFNEAPSWMTGKRLPSQSTSVKITALQ